MIVDSKLVCAQTYNEANIIPGRNAIPDDKGRALMKNRFFLDMINVKTGPHVGMVVVVVPPAELKADPKGAKASSTADDEAGGSRPEETAVSNLTIANAIKMVRTLTVVDQIQHIAGNDPRPEVREAAEKRIEQLAEEALKEAGKKDGDGASA